MTSKKLLIVLLLASVVQLYSQDKTIEFSYDNSGNQTERKLICINCSTTTASKTLTETTEEDFIPLETTQSDQITYYPNPVQEELYLKWELIDNKKVTSITVFTSTGTFIRSYPNTDELKLQTIHFGSLPSGVYLVMMQFNDGNEKTFKIIKE